MITGTKLSPKNMIFDILILKWDQKFYLYRYQNIF